MKAAIALFGDARRQPGLLPDAETDMARLETVMGGFDREQTRRVVKGPRVTGWLKARLLRRFATQAR